jgi:AcrR family transcriptional regulator
MPILTTPDDDTFAARVAVGARAGERRDAARNRRALLDGAQALIAESGVSAMTMDAVASRAGVGKGTLYRRFGSRAGLMLALLDRAAEELQTAVSSGPPPLGPGAADPVERLVAFGHAQLDLVARQEELLLAAGAAVFDNGVYLGAVGHIRTLLRQTGNTTHDLLAAQILVAGLDPQLIWHQRHIQGIALAELADNWALIARRIAGLAPRVSDDTKEIA